MIKPLFPLAAITLAVSACNTSETDDQALPSVQTEEAPPALAPIRANQVILRGEGLAAGSEAFYFRAGRKEVEGALQKALGARVRSSTNDECGAGPVASTEYPGGLTVNFQNETFVGWFWEETSDNIMVEGDIAVGNPAATLEAKPGFAMIDGSTLGEEFTIGEDYAGFFEDGKVSMLYSGTQCFFR